MPPDTVSKTAGGVNTTRAPLQWSGGVGGVLECGASWGLGDTDARCARMVLCNGVPLVAFRAILRGAVGYLPV